MSKVSQLTKRISNRLIALAEIAMWLFIVVGVLKLFFNGIVTLSSVLIALSISSIIAAAVFYLIAITISKRK